MLRVVTNSLYPQDVLNRNAKRLSRRDKIEEITKRGDKVQNRFLVARRRENQGDENRYGIVISSKVEKKAVARNRLRRQIYEAVRSIEKEGQVPNGKSFDIVFFVRKALLKEEFSIIKDIILDILNKIYGREKK